VLGIVGFDRDAIVAAESVGGDAAVAVRGWADVESVDDGAAGLWRDAVVPTGAGGDDADCPTVGVGGSPMPRVRQLPTVDTGAPRACAAAVVPSSAACAIARDFSAHVY
jgi:hypothetical protein